jgi:hypothetical protein
LIKGGHNEANDAEVSILPDKARMATNAAPTESTQIANKEYVDNSCAGGVWDDYDKDGEADVFATGTEYTAATKGTVVVKAVDSGASANPDIAIQTPTGTSISVYRNSGTYGYIGRSNTITCPIRKGDTWKVVDNSTAGVTVTIYWLPEGV